MLGSQMHGNHMLVSQMLGSQVHGIQIAGSQMLESMIHIGQINDIQMLSSQVLGSLAVRCMVVISMEIRDHHNIIK